MANGKSKHPLSVLPMAELVKLALAFRVWPEVENNWPLLCPWGPFFALSAQNCCWSWVKRCGDSFSRSAQSQSLNCCFKGSGRPDAPPHVPDRLHLQEPRQPLQGDVQPQPRVQLRLHLPASLREGEFSVSFLTTLKSWFQPKISFFPPSNFGLWLTPTCKANR